MRGDDNLRKGSATELASEARGDRSVVVFSRVLCVLLSDALPDPKSGKSSP